MEVSWKNHPSRSFCNHTNYLHFHLWIKVIHSHGKMIWAMFQIPLGVSWTFSRLLLKRASPLLASQLSPDQEEELVYYQHFMAFTKLSWAEENKIGFVSKKRTMIYSKTTYIWSKQLTNVYGLPQYGGYCTFHDKHISLYKYTNAIAIKTINT